MKLISKLPTTDGGIFVPLKLRLPRVVGDTSYGYIDLGIIDRVVPGENNHCRNEVIFGDSPQKSLFLTCCGHYCIICLKSL